MMEKGMSKDTNKDRIVEDDKIKEINSPVVNVEWQPSTYAEQFHKLLVDLQGVVDKKDYQN
tara:strand:- start:165 stop:347 length:183 start_codon:yes stop_codon:yes gene_type:complete